VRNSLHYYRKRVKALQGDTSPETRIQGKGYEDIIRELSAKQKRLPASNALDPNYRRLFYTRYADDTLIGIIGSKQEAEQVCSEVKTFLHTVLKLDIAEEKSGIHHAKEGTTFLGYVVQNLSNAKLLKIHQKNTKVVATRRTVKERLHLRVPDSKMSAFCQRKGYGRYADLRPSSRPGWLHRDNVEILLAYNAEMRGIANYYALANNAKGALRKLMYIAESSFLATLANKHKRSMSQIASKLRQGRDLCVTTFTKEGKAKRYTLFKLRDWKPPQPKADVDHMPKTAYLRFGRSTLEQRLKASICESCGKEGGYFEIHHVRKLKDLQGKQWWKQVMSYRKRKTMVLCVECHDLLHAGKLSKRQKEF
jgi:RNA-directed DNA polymerase